MNRRAVGVLVVVHALAPAPGVAQDRVAEVRQVAEVQLVGDAVRLRAPDQRVQFRPDPTAAWRLATDGQALSLSSALQLLDRPVAARISVRSATGRGMLTFIPSPLDPGGVLVVEADTVGLGPSSEGLYEFLPDTTGGADFVLALTRGAVIVDWQRGMLPVEVAGNRVEIRGTEATISLEPEGTRALAYLREGTMTVVGPDPLTLGPGQVVLLRAGLAPLLLSGVSAAQAGRFAESVEYLASDVWEQAFPSPGWQRPLLLGLGAAALAGGAWCVVETCWESSGSDAGRRLVGVVIRLPF